MPKPRPRASAAHRAKSVILIYLGGGLSHHDSFDLKPEATPEIRGKYGRHRHQRKRRAIRRAPAANGCPHGQGRPDPFWRHNNDHHETATNWAMSGRFGSAFGDYPAIGAVVTQQLGFKGTLPPYVAVPRNPSFTWELGKSDYLGGRYESFKTGDPNEPDFQVRDVAPAEPMSGQAHQTPPGFAASCRRLGPASSRQRSGGHLR